VCVCACIVCACARVWFCFCVRACERCVCVYVHVCDVRVCVLDGLDWWYPKYVVGREYFDENSVSPHTISFHYVSPSLMYEVCVCVCFCVCV